MMREPPAAPVMKYRLWFDEFSAMVGEMDESGRLPGAMKLFGVGI